MREKKVVSMESDEQLLLLLHKGSENAFTAIYDRYHKLLYTVAYTYLKNQEMAEDAVQQTFLKLWETRKILTIRINLKNYLFTMIKNHVLNEIRNNTNRIEKNYELVQLSSEYENDLLAELEEKERMKHFYEAINRLPEQKKRVCLLKLKEGLSNQDIAQKLNISIPTVKSHYSQSLKMLKSQLEKLLFILFSFLLS